MEPPRVATNFEAPCGDAPDLYGVLPPAVVTLPVPSPGARDALGNRRWCPRATRTVGFRRSRSARENPHERGLLPIPAAAALPFVHRRTETGRARPFAQGIGARPRALRKGNGLRRRCRSGRSRGCQAPSRQTARVLRGPSRSGRHLAAERQLRPGFRSEFRLTCRHGSSPGCSRAAADSSPEPAAGAAGSELQARQNRRRRCCGRGGGCRRRAGLARTQSDEHSSSTAPPGFAPRRRGAACVVSGRQPCRVRLVRTCRCRPDGYLRESRRERGPAAIDRHSVFRDQPGLVP